MVPEIEIEQGSITKRNRGLQYNSLNAVVKLIQSKKLLLKSIIKMENVSFKFDFEREKERRCFTEGYLNLIWLLRHFLGDHFGNVFSLSSEAKLNFCLYS